MERVHCGYFVNWALLNFKVSYLIIWFPYLTNVYEFFLFFAIPHLLYSLKGALINYLEYLIEYGEKVF